MRRPLTYCFWLLMLTMVLPSCDFRKKRLNKRITLWRKDDIPYGLQVAYDNLPYIFPHAEIEVSKSSPDPYRNNNWRNVTDIFTDYKEYKKKVRIIIAKSIYPDTREINALVEKVSSGEHVFMSAMSFSKELLDSFRLKTAERMKFFHNADSLTVTILKPGVADSASFTYPGYNLDEYVDSLDPDITVITGRDHKQRPDLVSFSYKNGGSIYFHFAPLTFSNFFLLHKDNMRYYEYALSQLPANADVVYWDEYFRYAHNDFSKLDMILSNESLRWAFWTVIGLFLLLFLFQSKRRQRIIPLITPLRNASLDFVKTIGRLYFQKRDNRNLAQKMAAHFLDHVRTRYNIPTSNLDEDFTERLAYKSGFNKETLQQIVYVVRTIHDYPSYTDSELMSFNKNLESFYNHS